MKLVRTVLFIIAVVAVFVGVHADDLLVIGSCFVTALISAVLIWLIDSVNWPTKRGRVNWQSTICSQCGQPLGVCRGEHAEETHRTWG